MSAGVADRKRECSMGEFNGLGIGDRGRFRCCGSDPDRKGTKKSADVVLSPFLSDFLS